jgi:hypothetical protein
MRSNPWPKLLTLLFTLFLALSLSACDWGDDDDAQVVVTGDTARAASTPSAAFDGSFGQVIVNDLHGYTNLGRPSGGVDLWARSEAASFEAITSFWDQGDPQSLMAPAAGDDVYVLDRFLDRYVQLTDAGIRLGSPVSNETNASSDGRDFVYQRFSGQNNIRLDLLEFLNGPSAGEIVLVKAGTWTMTAGGQKPVNTLLLTLDRSSALPGLIPQDVTVADDRFANFAFSHQGRLLYQAWHHHLGDDRRRAASAAELAEFYALGKGIQAGLRLHMDLNPDRVPTAKDLWTVIDTIWKVYRDARDQLGRPLATVTPDDVDRVAAWSGLPAETLMTAWANQYTIQVNESQTTGEAARRVGYIFGRQMVELVMVLDAPPSEATVVQAAAAYKKDAEGGFNLSIEASEKTDLVEYFRTTPRPWFQALAALNITQYLAGGELNDPAYNPGWVDDGLVPRGLLESVLGDLADDPVVRFYRDADPGRSYPAGGWWSRLVDVIGLESWQVQDILALPHEPTHFVLGEIKPGTHVVAGRVASWDENSGLPMTKWVDGKRVTTNKRVGGGTQIHIEENVGPPDYDWTPYINFLRDDTGQIKAFPVSELLNTNFDWNN